MVNGLLFIFLCFKADAVKSQESLTPQVKEWSEIFSLYQQVYEAFEEKNEKSLKSFLENGTFKLKISHVPILDLRKIKSFFKEDLISDDELDALSESDVNSSFVWQEIQEPVSIGELLLNSALLTGDEATANWLIRNGQSIEWRQILSIMKSSNSSSKKTLIKFFDSGILNKDNLLASALDWVNLPCPQKKQWLEKIIPIVISSFYSLGFLSGSLWLSKTNLDSPPMAEFFLGTFFISAIRFYFLEKENKKIFQKNRAKKNKILKIIRDVFYEYP